MRLLALMAPNGIGRLLPWIWLYIGPDAFLPIASVFGAIAGFALIFWQKLAGLVRRMFGRGTRVDGPDAIKPEDAIDISATDRRS
jgi:hypothetical protein